jgi:FrmR/RcnR family transcriptional regulator, repressor of frmRAB operon
MSHTVQEKQKLLARTRRIRGQIEAIERALENEAGCESIMHQIAASRGALAGLMVEVVEDHVRHHLVVPDENGGRLDPSSAESLVTVLRSYLK